MMRRNYFCLSKVLFFTAALILTGCSSIGSQVLPQTRQDFNAALLRSDEEELLLNVVRLQYGDRPYFLGISTVTASNGLTISSGGSYTYTNTHSFPPSTYSIANALGLSPDVSYSDTPTVIYTPLQGSKFTQQLLTPVSLETLYLLITSGWNGERVFRLTVGRIGPLSNAENAARPNSNDVIPDYQRFIDFVTYLRLLHVKGYVDMQAEKDPQFKIDIEPTPGNEHNPAIKQLYRMLGSKNTHGMIQLEENPFIESTAPIITPAVASPAPGTVMPAAVRRVGWPPQVFLVRTRSYIGMMYYLSKSVEVSPDDIKQGVVVVPIYPNGQPFKWDDVTHGIMRIHMSKLVPTHASVMVYYRNHWFYVADNDPDSKETLALLEQIYSLEAGEITGSPLLSYNIPT